ncbi:MAG: hypothetical protein HY680_05940 [Chloroflexi bacterium]|nr:hypothetical protein [Chloroflexota bacterium]
MGLVSLARFAALVALRRTVADWRLQAAAAFGVLLAAILMASGVIYSRALEETALKYTLRNASEDDVNLTVRVFHALEFWPFTATERFVQERVARPLALYFKESNLLVQTSTLYFTGLALDGLPEAERPRGTLLAITDLARHARLMEGRYPQRIPGDIEFATDAQGAALLGLSLEETFQAFPAVQGDQAKSVSVRLVGILEPLNPSEQFWRLGIRDMVSSSQRTWISVPMYADRDALFFDLGSEVLGLDTDFLWLFVLDREGLTASEAGRLHDLLESVREDVHTNLPHSSSGTKLVDILERHAALLVVARVPLFLVLFLALGMLLYYLFLIAGFLGRLRTAEVALMRSRGASLGQAGVVILMEGLIMALPSVAFAPVLALALVRLTSDFSPSVAAAPVLESIGLPYGSFLLAALGALLAVVVFTGSTLSAARHGMVAFRSASARPPEKPLFLRYYVDVALLGVIGMAWWQLRSLGTFLVHPVAESELSIDMALLLGPVLGALAGGLLLLRLFPVAMWLLTKVVEPFGPVWLVQALRRVGRDPVPSASLLVLLALASSLGVLSATVLTTLERSQRDQALYQAGADFRVQHYLGDRVVAGQSVAQSLAGLRGVEAAADAMRLSTRITTESLGDDNTLLAVDARRFAAVAWDRGDLMGEPLERVLRRIASEGSPSGGPGAGPVPQGIPLPTEASALGIWVAPGQLGRNPNLFARLRDSGGRYFDVLLGQLEEQRWTYLEGPIRPVATDTRRPLPTPAPPFTLHTLWAGSRTGGFTTGVLFLDQLVAITPGGPVEIASFQSVEGWHALEDPLAEGLYSLDMSESVARPGRKSAVFMWGRAGLALRGIRAGPPEAPIPALVSASFLETGKAKLGDTMFIYVVGVQVPVRLVASVPFFPSLDPHTVPFTVMDLEPLLQYLALHVPQPVYPGMEAWIKSGGDGPTTVSLKATLREMGDPNARVQAASALVAEREAHPLLTAGWSGLLSLSFMAVVLASASGLLLYTYIDAREQMGQLAIMRTLGFADLQVNGILWFNLALTVAVGTALGALGGRLLGGAILPLLAIVEGGARVTPPMVLVVNGGTLRVAYLVLALATGVTVAILSRAIARLEVQRLLRVAEA